MTAATHEIATLGGGCFWCLEAVFERVEGVTGVVSGYSGGDRPEPSYREVCSGATGHAEVVQVSFDPEVLSYRELLEVFFATHDPTTLDRQGADVGTQYRSIVLTHSEEQRRTAEELIDELERAGTFGRPIVTRVEPYEAFYRAEPEHQSYYARNPYQGYCQVVISPKVAKLRQAYGGKLKPEYR